VEYEKPTVNSRKRSTKATEKPPNSHGKTAQAEPEEAAAKAKEARTEPKHQGTGKATKHGKPAANRGCQGAMAQKTQKTSTGTKGTINGGMNLNL